ncbi:acyl-CoA dehydrogenase family protein [Streptomyces iconiensis]|uniref:Acyl-CoA dehydrogenase family protein n=1 Tax=Streptomyces iconiensis TaxID=1384038 RepID=A0ABT6ZYX9_9ACTN|nr:acyl-CoA dehydrogenase family protein [Streptomyces iconiensis]MDJ1134067.1 acyl-CoA dehydrogenase family protein [Streptomyces iconiensis]
MDFRLSEDQEALRRGMRELLEARFDHEALRHGAEAESQGAALDAGLWKELGEAGLFALRLSEQEGGVGLGLPEAVLVFEEAGRALLPGPLVASHLAAGLVPGAADGSVIVTALDLEARTPVEHLSSSARVLVLGTTVSALAPGTLTVRPMRSVDPLSPLHAVAEEDERADGEEVREHEDEHREEDRKGRKAGVYGKAGVEERAGAGRESLQADPVRLRREAMLLTAAQQLGSAGRTLDMAVAHARTREQFGQPIGAFQAVKHLCAGMLVRLETSRSVVYAASVTEDESEALAAKLLADEAAVANARDCLQVHGGMGFTWEAEVHLHLKRAWLRAEQWGTAGAAEDKLAAAL